MVESMSTYSADRAVIFTGDTNLEYDDVDEGPLMESFLADAGLTDACLDVGCPETDHIDRILLRSSDTLSLTAIEWANEPDFYDAGGTPLSDHPAISVVVSWEER